MEVQTPKDNPARAASFSGNSSATANPAPSTSLVPDSDSSAIPDVPPPSYEEATGISPSAPNRLSTAGLGGPGRRPSASSPSPVAGEKPTLPPRRTAGQQPVPGAIPVGRQFPPAFNLYTDSWQRTYTLGEHQQTPLYAVRLRPSWSSANPIVALHNGPNAQTAPLLAAIDGNLLSDQMSITLPPPLTYRGGSTAVPFELVVGWTHLYRFTIEVGTDRASAHQETFEWRHSFGSAIAALGGARDGWKLVRMSTTPLAGQPQRQTAFLTSDGREVVAVWSDAIMSISKLLKFAFIGTGLTGLLGERWAVMAVTSALGVWEKEQSPSSRR